MSGEKLSPEKLSAIKRERDDAPLFIEEILSSLGQGRMVLDAGCGAGSFQHSRFPGLDIVSIDIKTPDRVGVDAAARVHLPPNFVLGDLEKLPLKAGSIDFVVLNYALEHVFDANATVTEASRVLKSGGLLYAALPNSRSFDDKFYRFAGYFAKYVLLKVHKRLEHQQRFDFLSLNKLLYSKGFRLLSFCECPSGYTWMNDPRVKKFRASFLKILSFLKSAVKIDLFKNSNYLTLYRYDGTSGIRTVTHICAFCGMQLIDERERDSGPWTCPYCGERNVHC